MKITNEIETKNGTLRYQVVLVGGGFKGKVSNDLHKNSRLKGKVLTRYSPKVYKTLKGASDWLAKQIKTQNS